jgi:hypothetical protein
MRKLLIPILALAFLGSGNAHAHQPVELLNSDKTAASGPLLVDGTVSFAVRASFSKAGEKKAFRAAFKQDDPDNIQYLNVEYLIVDKKPESTLRPAQLPTLVITSPKGSSMTIKFSERTKFYEPYSRVNYLYLARYRALAEAGEYSFVITAKRKASITIGVGDREVAGEVLRGPKPTPTPAAAASSSPTPTATPEPAPTKAGYTMTQVRANNSLSKCWSVIEGNVYDLTNWIGSHPGGPGYIEGLCGKDGSSAFSSKHGNRSGPVGQLSRYRLGPLEK